MTIEDQFLLMLTAWRENRGGGQPGMQSVMNVILNRVAKRNSSAYVECIEFEQFSSITTPGDEQLNKFAQPGDAQWAIAQSLVAQAAAGTLADITGGATLYYAPRGIQTTKEYTLPDGTVVPFPDRWNAAVVTYTVTVQNQVFFK